MRTALAVAALAATMSPSIAAAQVPATIEIETCWYGVCLGITSRYHTVVTAPILSPNSGQLWNSMGQVGEYFYDPNTSSLVWISNRFPVAVYSGTIINGCLSGTATQIYYAGYGSFESLRGCP